MIASVVGWTSFPVGLAVPTGSTARSAPLEEYSNLCAYVARGEVRPAFKRAFDAQLAVFIAASTA